MICTKHYAVLVLVVMGLHAHDIHKCAIYFTQNYCAHSRIKYCAHSYFAWLNNQAPNPTVIMYYSHVLSDSLFFHINGFRAKCQFHWLQLIFQSMKYSLISGNIFYIYLRTNIYGIRHISIEIIAFSKYQISNSKHFNCKLSSLSLTFLLEKTTPKQVA